MGWTEDVPPTRVKVIGALEVLGALGLVLPWLLDTARWLTPLAALGLAVTMLGAIFTHRRRHESPVPPLALLVPLVVLGAARAASRG